MLETCVIIKTRS